MQVSFRSVFHSKDPYYSESKRQKDVYRLVDNAFYTSEIAGYSLSDFLDSEICADVCIKSKKNGNVQVYIKSDGSGEILKEKDSNRPLSLGLNLKSPMEKIKENIDKFVERCKTFAEKEYGSENLDEAKFLNASAKAALDPKRRKAMDALAEEERFVEEFDTDHFN